MITDFAGKTALITGAARATAAVLPGMLDAGWGRIVNVSSAIAAPPGQSAAALIDRLGGDDTGVIWDVSTAPARS